MALAGCRIEGSLRLVDIDTWSLQQQIYALTVAIAGCLMEGILAIPVLLVDICPGGDKQSQQLCVSVASGI